MLKQLLSADNPDAIRLSSAKWLVKYITECAYMPGLANTTHYVVYLINFSLTNLCRAGAFPLSDPMVRLKVLPCLVKLCKRDKGVHIRAEAAVVLGTANFNCLY